MSLLLRDLRKSFHQGQTQLDILKGLNADIKEAEIVAIQGPSGSGKSTLLSLLAGLDSPDSGEIIVQGQSLQKLNQNEMTKFRAQNLGIVFQQFHLIGHLTALENVMFPLEILGSEAPEERARAILDKMKLSPRLTHWPSQMSGGECQRVAMARALVVEPKVILADEPSGSLDVETGQQVMDEFFSLVRQQKITSIVVTHSESLAARCDRRLVLSHGLLL